MGREKSATLGRHLHTKPEQTSANHSATTKQQTPSKPSGPSREEPRVIRSSRATTKPKQANDVESSPQGDRGRPVVAVASHPNTVANSPREKTV